MRMTRKNIAEFVVTGEANHHIVILRETQNKSSETVNVTELCLLIPAECIRLISTKLMNKNTELSQEYPRR